MVKFSKEKMIAKVRGLLEKAKNEATSEEERNNLFAQTERLIAKHMIAEGELGESSPMTMRLIQLSGLGNLASPIGELYMAISELHSCYGVTFTHQGRGNLKLQIYGTDHNLDIVETLAEYLRAQLIADTNRDKPRSRKSYGFGWAWAVESRLQEAQQAAETEYMGLVPTSKEAHDYAHSQVGGITNPREDEPNSEDVVKGLDAGNTADIGLVKLNNE